VENSGSVRHILADGDAVPDHAPHRHCSNCDRRDTFTNPLAADATPSPTPLPQTICQAAADDQALLVIGPLNEPAPADASLGVSASALQARQIQDALVASRAQFSL